mgnify:CR=1 FL=1
MVVLKVIFSVLAVLFSFVGVTKLLPYDISLPIAFFFLGMVFLTNAKECRDKGAKRDMAIFIGVTIFIYSITVYNILTRIF